MTQKRIPQFYKILRNKDFYHLQKYLFDAVKQLSMIFRSFISKKRNLKWNRVAPKKGIAFE